MRRGASCRAGLGLLAGGLVVALLVPRSVPRFDLLDPEQRASEITEFGLRTVATLLAGYLVLVFLGLLLSAGRLLPASARALLGRWTTGGLAGGMRRFVGISALTLGVLPLQPVAAHAAEVAPVLTPEDSVGPVAPAPRLEPQPPAVPFTTTPPRPEPAAVEPLPHESAAPPTPTSPARPPEPDPLTRAGQVTVQPGESFWTVAERLTAGRLGRPPADVEVIEPWLALIEANRDRLTDPDDPDLLFPGQVLRLPD